MAHIKVVRRSMRPEEWNDLRFGWLKRYIINDKLPIDNIVIKDARPQTMTQIQPHRRRPEF